MKSLPVKSDDEFDYEDWELSDTVLGTAIPIGQYVVRKKLWRRPMGFLCNIDNLIDEEGNERGLPEIPFKSPDAEGKRGQKKGPAQAGQRGPGKSGGRKRSRSQGRQSDARGFKLESDFPARKSR